MTNYGISEKEKTNLLIDNMMYGLHTAIPALITEVDLEKQTLSAKIAIKRTVNINGVLGELEYPPLAKVPFFTLQNGGYAVTVPPVVGDACMLIFSERNADGFWKSGEIGLPPYAPTRRHDINDAVALVGFTPTPNIIPNYAPEGIEIRNRDKNACISLTKDAIRLRMHGVSLTITKDGISIDGDKSLTFNISDFHVNASRGIFFKSKESINFEAPVLNVKANTNIEGNRVNVETDEGQIILNGAVSVTGDLDANMIRARQGNKEAPEATAGKLTTGELYPWNTFLDRLTLEEKSVRFSLEAGPQPPPNTSFEVNIDFATLSEMEGYPDLAKEIAKQCADTLRVLFDATQNKLVLETVGTGKEDGHLTYLRDAGTSADATPGTLTTGALPGWTDFRNSLKNLGIVFKINIGGAFRKYALDYSKLTANLGWENFAKLLGEEHKDAASVTFGASRLKFETKKSGDSDGLISFMVDTSEGNSPAVFTSGVFDPEFETFVTALNEKDFGVSSSVNGRDTVFHMGNAEVAACSDFGDFFAKLFEISQLRPTVNYNRIVLETKNTGHGATIGYFSPVAHIDATAAYLVTGLLPSFAQIKNMYSQSTLNIIFDLEIDDFVNNYTITPQNLKDSADWGDIAALLQPTGESTTPINITYREGSLVFASPTLGRRTLSPLEYNPDPQTPSLNGAVILSGTPVQGVVVYPGSDEIDNISPAGASLLKLTKETGATSVDGKDNAYNGNSIHLLKGTADTGAAAAPGKDGLFVIENNSATLLRGTKDTDALLVPGLDPGEYAPGQYDRIMTLIGSLEVIEKITCKELVIKERTTMTGEIKANPRTVPEDESQTPEISEMIVDGGMRCAKNLTVLETATLNKLKVNSGAEITGNLTLDGGKIIGKNGIQLSFDFSGLSVNAEIHAREFEAGF
jgi:hypothetical protein